MRMQGTGFCALLSIAFAATTAVAQDDAITDHRPVAFTNARIITVSGKTIEHGTLVVRNGKIDALGAEVAPPAGARIVDSTEMTIMPGLVSAWSRAGLGEQGPARQVRVTSGRRGGRGQQMQMPSGGGAQNRAATKVIEGIYPKQDIFDDLLHTGVTSLALTPMGSAFPGLGALLNPIGKNLEQLTARDDAFVMVTMSRDPQTKKLLKDGFEKAKKIVEERKKPPEPAKPPEAAPAETKPGEPKAGETKPDAPAQPKPEEKKDGQNPAGAKPPEPAKKPEAPKDPNLEVLADLLEGKRRAILEIDSAADLMHWETVAEGVEFPRALVVTRHDSTSGTIDVVADKVKELKCAVLMQPDLSTLPRSRFLINPAKRLVDAGIEVGFLVGDNPNTTRALFFRLMELVRNGLPADLALRGVTLVPAKALGIEAHTGSLEVGKDANLLVFRGDPLSPTGELQSVWLAGREVPQQP